MRESVPVSFPIAKRMGEGDREAVEGANRIHRAWDLPPPPRCAWSPSPAYAGEETW